MSQTRKTNTANGFVRGSQSDGALARRSLYLIIGAFLATFLGVSLMGENGLRSWVRLHAQESRLKEEVAALAEGNEELEEKLQGLEEDPFALEKFAREEYHMLEPGEEVLLLPSIKTEKESGNTPQ